MFIDQPSHPHTPPPLDPTLAALAAQLRHAGCVYAEDEARLLLGAGGSAAELAARVAQRVAGLPLELVLGWAAFCGLRITLAPGVFIPRRRTEFLATQAARRARPGHTVLDLCCGTGAVAAMLATTIGRLHLHAADIDPAATRCARANLAPFGGHVHEGDLYDTMPATLRGRVDLIVANAPYVPTRAIETLPREARIHEPRRSVDGGPDGHRVQRRVAQAAPLWLAPGGCLLVETSEEQAPRTAEIFKRSGLVPVVERSEGWDATVVVGIARSG